MNLECIITTGNQIVLSKRDLYVLRGLNVIVTPHMAFYTDQAVSDMVKHSIESCSP
ncbi:MAG: hypothetical protein ACLT7B_07700 [[Ruminococcus] torques]